MITKASDTKRKILAKLVKDEKIREYIGNDDIEYPEDLIGKSFFPYLKADDTIQESRLCVGVEVEFYKRASLNAAYKDVEITFLCVCENNFLHTKTGYSRVDLLTERISELINWNSWLGFKFELVSDTAKPYNNKLYFRELVFSTVGNDNMVDGKRINR